jgi:hypothetical protein
MEGLCSCCTGRSEAQWKLINVGMQNKSHWNVVTATKEVLRQGGVVPVRGCIWLSHMRRL